MLFFLNLTVLYVYPLAFALIRLAPNDINISSPTPPGCPSR